MNDARRWLARLAALFGRSRRDREISAELDAHLALHIEDNLRAGMSPVEARRQALIKLGGLEQTKQLAREQRGFPFFESLWQDLSYAVRTLRKAPGFTAVAVLTLALGIGANIAIFSVVESVLLRPLPFKDPARLVLLDESNPGKVDRAGVPYPDYLVWKSQNSAFEEMAAYWETSAVNDVVFGGAGSAERARYSIVTNSFFSILGVQPSIGSGFTAEDEKVGGAKRFLMSDDFWRRVVGGKADAIGKPFLLDGEIYTLAGVLPSGFDFPSSCDVWFPVSALGQPGIADRISHPFRILGRLKPGVSLAQALAQIDGIQSQLARTYPATDANWRPEGRPLMEVFVGNVRVPLLILLGTVGFILLIACVNVVNLMLARASSREREFALRAALGASRSRLAQQAFTESFLVVVLGGALALGLADCAVRAIALLGAGRIPRLDSFHANVPALLFAAGIVLLTTVLVGIAPALQLSSSDLRQSLAESPRTGASPRRQRLRGALVIAELALALPLLCGASLLLRSLYEWSKVDPGFRPEHVVVMKIALPSAQYPHGEQTSVFLDRLLERLRSIPGVQFASAANFVPLGGLSDWGSFQIVGRAKGDWWTQALSAQWRAVSPNYFETIGIPLVRGREFTEEDERDHAPVMVVNEALARKFWPGADPLGQRIVFHDQPSRQIEIVGIVGNVKTFGLDADSPPEMYTPYGSWWYMNLVLRSRVNPTSLFTAVRAEVAHLDKGVAVYGLSTMDQLLARSVAPRRFNLFLLGLFALLALVLAMVGIYGVMSYAVAMRTHEIGIRMALGAGRRQILRLVLGRGARLALAGVTIGVAAAFALTRLMASLLFGVKAADPIALGGAAMVLAAVALAASYVPAHRASRVDPAVVLRGE